MSYAQLSGALKLPVVGKLRAVSTTTKAGTKARTSAAAGPLAELVETLRPLVNSGSLAAILAVAGTFRQDIPAAATVRDGFARIVKRMQTEGAFYQRVADAVPDLLAEYGPERVFDLPKDPRFQELLK